jgi:hypothetical protein
VRAGERTIWKVRVARWTRMRQAENKVAT